MPCTKEIFLCAISDKRAVSSAALYCTVSLFITNRITVCYHREIISRDIYNRYLLNVSISMFNIDRVRSPSIKFLYERNSYLAEQNVVGLISYLTGNGVTYVKIKLLQTKCSPLYLKPQSVPRCKHFSSRL